MKYSLVDDELQEAQPGLIGKCQSCDSPTVAKCGKLKIKHWAHKGKRMCDPWWENETEWHRAWKDQFPKDWQEIIHYAENGEKHISDVKTDKSLVIEFQHSHINTVERQSREDFYGKMIWIIDGLRRLRDKKQFHELLYDSTLIDSNAMIKRVYHFDESALLRDWVDSSVPVFFDFGDDLLWGLNPKTNKDRIYVFGIDKKVLIGSIRSESQVNGFEDVLKYYTDFIAIDNSRLDWNEKDRPFQIPPPFPQRFIYKPRRRWRRL